MAKALTIEQVIIRCAKFKHVYISGWTGMGKKFTTVCECGNTYLTWLCNIEKGHKCSQCSGGIKHTKEYVKQELQLHGIVLVGEYKKSRIPFTFICRCGGIGKNTLHHVLAGQGCGNCAENTWREKFYTRGCEIITYNSARDITFRCSCGSIHNVQANNWETQVHGCPSCKVKYNYEPHRLSRQGIHLWRKMLLIRDSFKCRHCGYHDNLQAHHIEAFSIKPELCSDVDNGIILCNVCHQSLHSIYGWNVGRENLMRALNENS